MARPGRHHLRGSCASRPASPRRVRGSAREDDDRPDAALLIPTLRGGIDPHTAANVGTVDEVLSDLGAEGHLYRYRHGDEPLGATEGAFLLCEASMALALQRLGGAKRPGAGSKGARTRRPGRAVLGGMERQGTSDAGEPAAGVRPRVGGAGRHRAGADLADEGPSDAGLTPWTGMAGPTSQRPSDSEETAMTRTQSADTRDTASARVAVVTGGSAGLGRAVVRELASRGWDVGVIARNEDGLEGRRRRRRECGPSWTTTSRPMSPTREAVDDAAGAIEDALGPDRRVGQRRDDGRLRRVPRGRRRRLRARHRRQLSGLCQRHPRGAEAHGAARSRSGDPGGFGARAPRHSRCRPRIAVPSTPSRASPSPS